MNAEGAKSRVEILEQGLQGFLEDSKTLKLFRGPGFQ